MIEENEKIPAEFGGDFFEMVDPRRFELPTPTMRM